MESEYTIKEIGHNSNRSAFSRYFPTQIITTKNIKAKRTPEKLRLFLNPYTYENININSFIQSAREKIIHLSKFSFEIYYECSICKHIKFIRVPFQKNINYLFKENILYCKNCKIFICDDCSETNFAFDNEYCFYCFKNLNNNYFI